MVTLKSVHQLCAQQILWGKETECGCVWEKGGRGREVLVTMSAEGRNLLSREWGQ